MYFFTATTTSTMIFSSRKPDSFHICATCSELPSNLNTTVYIISRDSFFFRVKKKLGIPILASAVCVLIPSILSNALERSKYRYLLRWSFECVSTELINTLFFITSVFSQIFRRKKPRKHQFIFVQLYIRIRFNMF